VGAIAIAALAVGVNATANRARCIVSPAPVVVIKPKCLFSPKEIGPSIAETAIKCRAAIAAHAGNDQGKRSIPATGALPVLTGILLFLLSPAPHDASYNAHFQQVAYREFLLSML
jgi:hypothetical protein